MYAILASKLSDEQRGLRPLGRRGRPPLHIYMVKFRCRGSHPSGILAVASSGNLLQEWCGLGVPKLGSGFKARPKLTETVMCFDEMCQKKTPERGFQKAIFTVSL